MAPWQKRNKKNLFLGTNLKKSSALHGLPRALRDRPFSSFSIKPNLYLNRAAAGTVYARMIIYGYQVEAFAIVP